MTKRMTRIVTWVIAAMLIVAAGCMLASCGEKKEEKATTDVQQAASASTATKSTITEKPFYVLVVGNDTRKGTIEEGKGGHGDKDSRSDTMMLLRVDPKTYQIAIVTVPRDTQDTSDDGKTVKLNDAYQWAGMPGAVKHTEALTGVKIDYYFNMTFAQFVNFVDKLEGVTVDIPMNMDLQDIIGGKKIYLKEGDNQTLNGAEALVFARQRKQYADDLDACRQIQDRKEVQSLITKVASQDPSKASAYADILAGLCDTDMPKADLNAIVEAFMKNSDKITFLSGTGPYEGEEYMVDGTPLWLATRDEDKWAELIETIEEGGDPTDVVPLPKVKHA